MSWLISNRTFFWYKISLHVKSWRLEICCCFLLTRDMLTSIAKWLDSIFLFYLFTHFFMKRSTINRSKFSIETGKTYSLLKWIALFAYGKMRQKWCFTLISFFIRWNDLRIIFRCLPCFKLISFPLYNRLFYDSWIIVSILIDKR